MSKFIENPFNAYWQRDKITVLRLLQHSMKWFHDEGDKSEAQQMTDSCFM